MMDSRTANKTDDDDDDAVVDVAISKMVPAQSVAAVKTIRDVAGTITKTNKVAGTANKTVDRGVNTIIAVRSTTTIIIVTIGNIRTVDQRANGALRRSPLFKGFWNCIQRDTASCVTLKVVTFHKRPIRSFLARCWKSTASAKAC